jgi:hypothetical protein
LWRARIVGSAINAGLGLLHPALDLVGREVLVPVVGRLELAAIDRDDRLGEGPAGGTCGTTPLLAAATGLHARLGGDGSSRDGDRPSGDARAPIRGALVRFWVQQRLLRAPMPLTGDRALPPETPWECDTWMPAFLMAPADEAADGLDRLVAMDRARLGHLARGRPRHGGEEYHATSAPPASPSRSPTARNGSGSG